jgi:hypothetical protein
VFCLTHVIPSQYCYGLAFVLLAYAHAHMAGIPGDSPTFLPLPSVSRVIFFFLLPSGAGDGAAATFALMEEKFWDRDNEL